MQYYNIPPLKYILKLVFSFICLLSYPLLLSAQTQVGADIDGEAAFDLSGRGVCLSSDGSRVAIGADRNDGTGGDVGHVRVFELQVGTWTQLGTDIYGEANGDRSGRGMSLSSDGSRVAIGAPRNDGTGADAGHVRVFELQVGGIWTQLGTDIDGEAANDQSGYSVSLSSNGSRVAIGARQNDGTGTDAGHVRVFELQTGTWTQLGTDIDGEAAGDESGYSVSLSSDGSLVAIGAPRNDGTGADAGHVRVFELQAGTWTQLGTDIDGEAASDQSGYSISLSSVSLSSDCSRVAIGANKNDGTGTDAGHVRVFELQAGTWTQLGADIDGEATGDESGRYISLSSDGFLVAIGAIANDGTGSNAGHVRVFELQVGTWTQVDTDIDGEVAGDESGGWVSLSSNGSRVAIGAIGNDGTGSSAGHARIYDLSSRICLTLTPPTGTSNYWIGCTSSNWNRGTNWSTGLVPTGSDVVYIPIGTAHELVIDKIVSCAKMIVQIGAVVKIDYNAGGKLRVQF